MCITQEDGIACCFEVGHPLHLTALPFFPTPQYHAHGKNWLVRISIYTAQFLCLPVITQPEEEGKGSVPPAPPPPAFAYEYAPGSCIFLFNNVCIYF